VVRSWAADTARVVRELPSPSYFPRRDAAAAPVGGPADRQTLVVGHRL
jgi:hypothetical protein